MIDEKQITYFEMLYETRNVTRAASALYVSRQALSADIAKLEKKLGMPLFKRTQTGLVPLAAADALHEYAQFQQASWNDFEKSLRSGSQRRVLRIGDHISHGSRQVFSILFAFERENPDIRLEIVDIEDYSETRAMVADRRIDVGMARKVPKSDLLCVRKAFFAPIDVIVGKQHPLANSKAVDFQKDLSGSMLVFTSRETMEEAMAELPDDIHAEIVEPNTALLLEAVIDGGRIFGFPRYAKNAFESEDVIRLPSIGCPVCGTSSMFTNTEPSSDALRFLSFMERRLDAIGSGCFCLAKEALMGKRQKCPVEPQNPHGRCSDCLLA